ncbi:hypothetical protein [Pantoea agglomerans]|uniref:hypothetical protein n=1 Tax=Enterobacter agglomerans TaxID=549 RepID=UPI001FD65FCC|nr:hypothetical protein [Pantoea agglomerans]UOV16973.1 hypothetical protein LZ609_00410 [Pantoea agglomerans]
MNATMLARSIVSGVASVPMDFYLGLERTFQDLNLSDGGRRIQSRNMHDDIRIGRVVYQAFKDRNEIAKIVKIIIDDSLQYLPEPVLRKVYDTLIGGATSMTSRTTTQLSLSSYLGSKVVSGVMLSFISRVALRGLTGGLTGGVIAQGMISRACEASRRLQMQNPELWRKLRLNDYDMLYFMFEEPLQNFIKMGEMLRKNPSASREFIHAIENY